MHNNNKAGRKTKKISLFPCIFYVGKIGKIPEHLGLSRQLLMVGLSTWQNLMFDVPKKNIRFCSSLM